jgi:hypothetical protein
MTSEAITLLVLLASGEVQETPYQKEWPCVQAAAKIAKQGKQAYCVITTPDQLQVLEKYPD